MKENNVEEKRQNKERNYEKERNMARLGRTCEGKIQEIGRKKMR